MSPYIVSVVFATVLGLATAQVPGFGGCPEFVAMSDFDMTRFLGTWYEAERYVNIFEAGTRCVRTNYTKAVDGRFIVINEITNRYTGVKRVLEGEIRLIVKGAESKLNVRYPNLPIPYDTQYTVLETDYDDYAVVWSCSSLGVVNTQNAWVMTRQKLPSGTTLQKAYGVLDKFKLSRSFFFKTDQESCNIVETIKTEQAAKDGDNIVGDASEHTEHKVPAPVAPVVPLVAPAAPAIFVEPVILPAVPVPVPVHDGHKGEHKVDHKEHHEYNKHDQKPHHEKPVHDPNRHTQHHKDSHQQVASQHHTSTHHGHNPHKPTTFTQQYADKQ